MHTGTPLHELANLCAVDTETTGLNSWKGDRPFMITFYDECGNSGAYFWEVDPFTRKPRYEESELKTLRRFFKQKKRTCVFWNAKFDMLMLASAGIPYLCGNFEEGMYAMHCVNTIEFNYGLKEISTKYLDMGNEDQKDLKRAVVAARRVGKTLGWTLGPAVAADYWMAMDKCLVYGIRDTERTMRMWLELDDWLDEEEVRPSYELEKKLFPVVMRMEQRGVRIDPVQTRREKRRYQAKAYQHLQELRAAAPEITNFNSDAQLRKHLFSPRKKGGGGGLGLKPTKLTPTGLASVSMKAIGHIEHPFLQTFFRYGAATKAANDFFGKYMELSVKDEHEDYWVLHCNFQQVGPKTGRFACREPNLQNVPDAEASRSIVPVQARAPFGPRTGYWWIGFDYQQQEIRVFADVAQEPFLLAAIAEGQDIHDASTNRAWGGADNPVAVRAAYHALELDGTNSASGSERWVLVQEANEKFAEFEGLERAEAWLASFNYDIIKAEKSVMKKRSRGNAKMLSFLKIYGGGVKAAMDLLRTDYTKAKQVLDDYDAAFPRIAEYSDELIAEAEIHGFIRDRYGRKLRIPPDRPYVCVNYNVQGSSASFVKNRMVALDEYLYPNVEEFDMHQVLTVHDEVIVEVPIPQDAAEEEVLKERIKTIAGIMQDHGGHFGVPLPLDIELMRNSWTDKEVYEIN
jgi:DNA polymerase I-like protein with 3'-5' exonuclease and polymerase domains